MKLSLPEATYGAATRPENGRTAGFLQAALLIIGSCLPVMAAVLIAPVLPKMQASYAALPHVDILVPVMLTVPSLVLGLMSPFAGALVDRIGRKRLLLVAFLLYGVAGTAPLWLRSLYAIIGSRALVGLAEAAIMTSCTTLIGDYWDGAQRERLLTMQTVVSSIAATCFFMSGGALGEQGWRAPFVLYAVGFVLWLPALWFLHEPRFSESITDATIAQEDDSTFPLVAICAVCAITLVSAVCFYLVPVHLSFLLDGLGVHSTERIGQAIGISSVATVIGAAGYPVLARLGVGRHLALAFALMCAGFLWLSHVTEYQTVVLAASVACLGAGAVIPTLVNWMMRTVSFAQRGRGTGAFLASFFLGQFICPLVVLGIKAATNGSLAAAIGSMGFAAGAATIIALIASVPPITALLIRTARPHGVTHVEGLK